MTDLPIVVRDDRHVISVTGTDRRSFLDATLSQSLGDLPAGAARGALWLDIHGATLADLVVVAEPDDERLLLLVGAEAVPAVIDGLAMRTFLADAQFEPVTGAAVVAVRGEGPPGAGWPEDEVCVQRDGLLLVGRLDGVDVVGPAEVASDWLEASGLPAATADLTPLLDHEVRLGIPRSGHEIVAPHLPEEMGVLPTHVHLAKGCYPGQEAVARMWMLGRPRRRLVVLDLDGPVAPGATAGDGRDRITVTRTTSGEPWAALAFAPTSLDVGAEVALDGRSARVRSVAGAGRPQPGVDPAVTRRRDRDRPGSAV